MHFDSFLFPLQDNEGHSKKSSKPKSAKKRKSENKDNASPSGNIKKQKAANNSDVDSTGETSAKKKKKNSKYINRIAVIEKTLFSILKIIHRKGGKRFYYLVFQISALNLVCSQL